MPLSLSQATFTAQSGCMIQINDFMADISTKPSLVLQSACIIVALDHQDSHKAEALMISPCGQDGTIFACSDPSLVELAVRHLAWLNDEKNAPWADTAALPLPPLEAAMAIQQHISTLDVDQLIPAL